jgi:hypothetical protein
MQKVAVQRRTSVSGCTNMLNANKLCYERRVQTGLC